MMLILGNRRVKRVKLRVMCPLIRRSTGLAPEEPRHTGLKKRRVIAAPTTQAAVCQVSSQFAKEYCYTPRQLIAERIN
jgi:hypothetical protein